MSLAILLSGLSDPHLVRIARRAALDRANNHLFVYEQFDASSGAVVNPHFISGAAYGLALDDKNHLLVGTGNDTVGEYDATPGAAINANFTPGPIGKWSLAFVPAVPEPCTT